MIEEMPELGFGTWQIEERKRCIDSVVEALDTGYRHIDTAQVYKNEEYVGEGINKSGIDRNEIFLATKVWINRLSRGDVKSSTEKSLEKLQTEQVDILYIHWPADTYQPRETLKALMELVDEGKTRYIGLSNFTEELIDEAMDIAGDFIGALQVEMHPLLQQESLLEYTQERDLNLVAYSPLARGRVFDIPELNEVAEKHGVSEAQVSLAWLIEKDAYPIPKSETTSHIRDNYGSLDVGLDKDDIEKIDSITEKERLVEPEFSPW